MHRFALLLSVALVAASAPVLSPAASAAPPNAAPPAADEPAAVPDQLLVGYDIGTSAAERADARGQAGARRIEDVVRGDRDRRAVELVALPSGADRGVAIRRFEQNPNVAYAEPNWIVTHQATSDDTYYAQNELWGVYGDKSSPANEYGSQAAEAWTAGNTGSSDVVVGVIDEGIDITHPDLKDNIWVNHGEGVAVGDGDNNGYLDDVNGWDFYNNDNTVYDGTEDDHGTHVAGTIAGVGGNGIGVAGVAWNAKLISAKFLGPDGGTTANAIKAVDYLTDLKVERGVNIVASNNSWGGGGFSQGLYAAIERANEANILFVAAAGNGGRDRFGDDTDTTPHYPSSYDNSNIIAVASITSDGARSGFSNYGDVSVDLGAPGSGIYSTLPDKKYGSYSGTSMATPHVTGGVVLAAASGTSGSAGLKERIMLTALPTMSLAGRTVTGGRLNLSDFASASGPTNESPIAKNDGGFSVTSGKTLSVAAPGVLWNDSDPEGSTITATLAIGPSSGTLALESDGSFTFTSATATAGNYTFTYQASDGFTFSSPATVTITVTEATTTKTKGGGGGDKGGGKSTNRGKSTR